MFARAKNLMKKPIVATGETSLSEVAATMETRRISVLPIVHENGELRGIISKTDLVHFSFSGDGDWRDSQALEAMSPAVISCSPDSTIPEVASLMKENRIHHVLVMEGKSAVGVISALDLAEPMLKAYEILRNSQAR